MAARSEKQPLMAPGNEAEWIRLNAEKREALTPPPDTPIGELLRRGQHLSAQGAKLLRAVERANGDRRS
jgi:hypothetical protein